MEIFPRRKEHFLLVKKHTHYHRCLHGYFLKFFRAAILQKSSKSLIFWFVKSAQGQLFFYFPGRSSFFLIFLTSVKAVPKLLAIKRKKSPWYGLQSCLYLLSLKNTSFVCWQAIINAALDGYFWHSISSR